MDIYIYTHTSYILRIYIHIEFLAIPRKKTLDLPFSFFDFADPRLARRACENAPWGRPSFWVVLELAGNGQVGTGLRLAITQTKMPL